MRAFGIDISSHQGKVDFDKLATNQPDVMFIGIRNGISWGYNDKWFSRNWAESKRILRLRTAYQVLYPGESAQKQMDRYYRLMGDDIGELPETLDAELVHNQTKLIITKAILSCDDINYKRTGRHMLLYSRANWIDEHTYYNEISHLHLWLAQYIQAPFPAPEYDKHPVLPKGALSYLFHQTGDHTPGKDAGFGVESEQLDYDRFNGTAEELFAYANFYPLAPIPLFDWAQKIDAWARTEGFDGPPLLAA